MALGIKKGDKVVVLAGKDKGKQGKVLRVLPGKNRVVVEGVAIVKKHQRPRKQGEKGQVLEVPSSVNRSNLAVYCSSCKKGVRLGSEMKKDKKVRVCAKCKKEI